jgi:glyoxylase-like metal-dependent hydrolase (beta-lactamase superfamily II)
MRTTHLIATAALLVASTAFAQDFSNITIKPQKVAGNVYMLTGAGGNIGVSVGDDGIVIIDDQFAPLAPKIHEALRSISNKPIRFVINTHFHGDHTGGNEIFGAEAPIIAQTNARKRLQNGATVMGNKIPPAPKGALPVITFDDSVTVHANGEDIRAVFFPHGHTDGDSIILFPQSNVVHMGDDFFSSTFPFVDRESGGSVSGMIAAVDKIIATTPDDVKVIPGHGALSDKAGLRSYVKMLKETSAAVRKGISAGKSLEQLKSAKVLAPWSKWASDFVTLDFFTQTLYDEAKAKR